MWQCGLGQPVAGRTVTGSGVGGTTSGPEAMDDEADIAQAVSSRSDQALDGHDGGLRFSLRYDREKP